MDKTQNRLAIVIPSAYLTGGVQVWLDYVVPGLESRGWAVTVMPVHGRLHNAWKYLESHPFKNTHLIANTTGTREGRIRALIYAIKAIKPDMVLSVNIVDVYDAIARLRQKDMRNVRVGMALHGFNSAFFRDMSIYNKILDGVITTNRLGVAAAREISGIDKSRIHYAPCGVVMGNFPTPKRSGVRLTLLYAGRFDQREKNILDIPKILVELDKRKIPFLLRLAGTGPDEEALRTALSRFEENIEFVGHLDDHSLRTLFYQPDAILLITSPSESGPLVAWEAMSCGSVIVTSDYLGIGRESSLHDGINCLIFPVSNTSAAANAIARLQDTQLRSKLIRAGYELVQKKYSREASIASWDLALKEIQRQQPKLITINSCRPPLTGRLDRYLGISLAETLRQFMKLEFIHTEPGGEWPHSYSNTNDQKLVDRLHILDHT